MKSTSATRDVSGKPATLRIARAEARVTAKPATIRALRSGKVPKADPVGVAKVAAIQGAKETSRLIPYCHPVPLDGIQVTIETGRAWIDIETQVTAIWKTGVEMEALVAASAAALTLYDMLKPVDDTLEIVSVRLTHKSGGKSGTVSAAPATVRARAKAHPGGRAGGPAGAGVRAAVLVLSDTVASGKGRDESGRILAAGLRGHGATVPVVRVLPDERKSIARTLKELCDAGAIDLVLATGGTGVGPRDVTTEAVAEVLDRRLHGVENAFFAYAQERFPTAMLSRCLAGTRNRTVIVAIPGSPSAARDALGALFPALFHAIPMMKGGGHG
jgi:cyclic pyranopterin phosphate synthase